jgi:5-methylcytosine-specific restriction endonuclease McrA
MSRLNPLDLPLALEDYREPPMPPALRLRILQRDDYRCQFCGRVDETGRTLAIHEMIPYLVAKEAARDDVNLKVACWVCHKKYGKGVRHLGKRLENMQKKMNLILRQAAGTSKSKSQERFDRKKKKWENEP